MANDLIADHALDARRPCRAYWSPLRLATARRGARVEDADDLTQEFILSIIERGDLAGVTPDRGRFRAWLLACLRNFLSHVRERELVRSG